MRYAGLGLVAYAIGLGVTTFFRTIELTPELHNLHLLITLLPSLFWLGAIVYLMPELNPFEQEWQVYLFPALPVFIVSTALLMILRLSLIPAIPITLLATALWLIQHTRQDALPQRPVTIIVTATLFFMLGVGLLILPTNLLTSDLVILAISGDLIFLGYAIAVLDAYDLGETFLPDFLRSLGMGTITTLLFGGQVVLVMIFEQNYSPAMTLLLLITLATAIVLQTFSVVIQQYIDRIFLKRTPQLQEERAELQSVANALPRMNTASDLTRMPDDEFNRLTRRALSAMGDLSKLATSPLINLPAIKDYLHKHSQIDNTLNRATALRHLLVESIARLQPFHDDNFNASDEWRYYNALYYPYVIGLKPYSRRAIHDDLDPNAADALDWFRTYIPERTLYNWQNAAAKLIAQDLREQSEQEFAI